MAAPLTEDSAKAEAGNKALAILQAAVKVFSRRGPAGARIEEIARTAGVGKGTIYGYFSSKDDLFEQVILFAVDTQVALVSQALQAGVSLRASLEGALQASFQLVADHHAMVRVVIDNPTGGPSRDLRRALLQRQQRLLAAVQESIRRHGTVTGGREAPGQAAGDNKSVLAAHIFVGVLQTLSVGRLLLEEPSAAIDPALALPAPELARAAVDLLLQGLE